MANDDIKRAPDPMTERPELKRGISRTGFFAMAFGSMIGVGWVTALGTWFTDAGPLGAVIGFLAGGALMVFIGLCYAELCAMLPVAGGEVAYSYRAFGAAKAFLIGWPLAFGYLSVSAFEAISVAEVLGNLIPDLDWLRLYAIEGSDVFASDLLLALLCTAGITWVNWRGGTGAARLQIVLVALFGAATLAFLIAGLVGGDSANARPLFQDEGLEFGDILAGIGAVFVTAPFWFVGFDTIPQAAEEASDSVAPRSLAKLLLISIVGAAVFYALLIWSVACTGPWQNIPAGELTSAWAFDQAFGSPLLGDLVLIAALLGLFTSWNGFFLAGSRVLFALGRGRIAAPGLGAVHDRHGSPTQAILVSGVATMAGACLGFGAVGAIATSGSFCIALAFLGVTFSLIRLRKTCQDLERPYRLPGGLVLPVIAAAGGALLLALQILPGTGATLDGLEWTIIGVVAASGIAAWWAGSSARNSTSERERARRILGAYAPDADESP